MVKGLETLILGKTEGKRRSRQQRMRWLHSITDSTIMNLSKLWKIMEDRGAWCAAIYEFTNSRTRLSDRAWNLQNHKEYWVTSVLNLSYLE